MHTRKNAFSYIMWGLFALFMTVVYYFSLHNLLLGLNIFPTAYIDLIVIVVAAALVELVILTDQFFKAKSSPEKQSELKVFVQIFIFVVFALFIAARIVMAISVKNQVQFAISNRFMFGNSTEVFTTLLTITCDLFGRLGSSLFGLQIVLGLLAAILIYLAIKLLYGRIEAFCCLIGLCFMPIYIEPVISVKPTMLNLFYFALALILVAIYKCVLEDDKRYHWSVLPIALILGTLSLYSGSILTVVFFLVFVTAINPYISKVARIIDYLLILAGFMIGFNNYILIDLCMGQSAGEAYANFCNNAYSHFTFAPDMTPFLEFSGTNFILIIVVVCITYLVMFLRCDSDNGYSLVLFILTSFAYMCLFGGKDNTDFYMVTIIAMVGLGGSGIAKIADRYYGVDRLLIPSDYIKGEHTKVPENTEEDIELLEVPEVTNIPIVPSSDKEELLSNNYEEGSVPSVMDIVNAGRSSDKEGYWDKLRKDLEKSDEQDNSPRIRKDYPLETGLSTLGMFDDYDWTDIPEELMRYDLE